MITGIQARAVTAMGKWAKRSTKRNPGIQNLDNWVGTATIRNLKIQAVGSWART